MRLLSFLVMRGCPSAPFGADVIRRRTSLNGGTPLERLRGFSDGFQMARVQLERGRKGARRLRNWHPDIKLKVKQDPNSYELQA